ncbi:SDR family oxidoreductase [Salinibacterium sp. ZJ450]|uniref:SDR family oxidoreductase n=1 Tax=Salinibacterium sp. ZJ450 TaxID=2708338 RepID=UPI00141FD101|nr:SDR family oxidoreductase [Salinibacterium sp. ZJ450]
MTAQAATESLVFGATGFIGRWLVRQLLLEGEAVVAATRTASGATALRHWLHEHDTETSRLRTVIVDFQTPQSVATSGLHAVRDVFNVAGGFAFGMSHSEAFAANVEVSRAVVATASQVPHLRRLVHLSGYRVGGQDPSAVPWSDTKRAREYRRLGAYEGSKVESDAVVQAEARRLGVPLTIVNPATVIGDSVRGESEQLIGLADTVLSLSRRTLPAVPGNSTTFVPVVTVDYLAQFMTILPRIPETSGCSYWVLDDATPPLPALLASIGRHLGVPAPRWRVPVWLIRALPRSITQADPETLSFLSSDRYPTGPAAALAARHGLHFPDVRTSLHLWADYLVGRSA